MDQYAGTRGAVRTVDMGFVAAYTKRMFQVSQGWLLLPGVPHDTSRVL